MLLCLVLFKAKKFRRNIMQKPYIGITDFMNASQIKSMCDVFIAHGGLGLQYRLMVGVMMSYKTLHEIPSRWNRIFPKKEDISEIFVPHPVLMNTLHYADYTGTDIASSLEQATLYGNPFMNALQLDMIWPDPEIIREYKEKHPNIEIVLQTGRDALEIIQKDPERFVKKIDAYGDALDFILLDCSMGKGRGMNASFLARFVRALTEAKPMIGIAAAGGLGPDSIHLVEPLIREFPRLSIDAQGQMRSSGNTMDPIEWDRVEIYLEKAIALFRKHKLHPLIW
jgi:hypothetical protein